MIFEDLNFAGVHLIHLERVGDQRGYNARAWCAKEFADHGLDTEMVQTNIISNARRGTLRGMHYQTAPFADAKLFRVTRGRLYDVVVDLRTESPTWAKWFGVELAADKDALLFVPGGLGQGFLTLEDDTDLTYQVSAPYSPRHGRGFRYDDLLFAIEWPEAVQVISDKDLSWPAYTEGAA